MKLITEHYTVTIAVEPAQQRTDRAASAWKTETVGVPVQRQAHGPLETKGWLCGGWENIRLEDR